MYKAIGDAAYNDGLFSQAAPFQEFQASVSQFADGGLGAIRLPSRMQRRMPGASRRPVPYTSTTGGQGYRPVSGLGNVYRDGVLGKTFLPAFSPQEMRGLGHAYHDGVLGADALTISAGPQATPAWKPDLASIGIGVMAGALLLYGVTRA